MTTYTIATSASLFQKAEDLDLLALRAGRPSQYHALAMVGNQGPGRASLQRDGL